MTAVDKPEQIPLNLPVEEGAGRDDLVVTPFNVQILEQLEAWPNWPSPIAILAGPIGSGKTHLAHIWAELSGAIFISNNSSESVPVAEGGAVVVEDIAHGNFDQTWLFHLFNSVRAANGGLLLTSRDWPGNWGITLPDLESRMKTAQLMELPEPDDALLYGVLSKLFSDRQIQVPAKVIDYLVVRMERSLATAQNLVAEIDSLSLAQKKAVTKNLAGDALRNLGLQE